MKKLLALLLALMMALSLVACGQSAPADDSAAPDDGAAVEDTVDTPAPALEGTMKQDVTVNLLGNDVPVAVQRNFDEGFFRVDYSFNGNAVFAEGNVVDGAWEIVNTNNDFTFGTVEEVLKVLDDAAWVAADAALVVAPAEEAPADETPAAPAGVVADGTYDITLNMMGNDVPVAVTVAAGTFELAYQMMGNDVSVKGTIGADGTWTATEMSNPMAANTVPMVQAALAG